MQCANPPREWRKFRDLSSKSRRRTRRPPGPIRAPAGIFANSFTIAADCTAS